MLSTNELHSGFTQKSSKWNPFKLNIWMEGAI